MCLKVVSGERRFWQLTKATLAERTISAATATFICVVISAATRWTRSLKVVLQNAQFPKPQRHFSYVPKKSVECVLGVHNFARRGERATS